MQKWTGYIYQRIILAFIEYVRVFLYRQVHNVALFFTFSLILAKNKKLYNLVSLKTKNKHYQKSYFIIRLIQKRCKNQRPKGNTKAYK